MVRCKWVILHTRFKSTQGTITLVYLYGRCIWQCMLQWYTLTLTDLHAVYQESRYVSRCICNYSLPSHCSSCLSHTPAEPHINGSLYQSPVCCLPAKELYPPRQPGDSQPNPIVSVTNDLKNTMKGNISTWHAVSKGRNVSIVGGRHLGWFRLHHCWSHVSDSEHQTAGPSDGYVCQVSGVTL